jgi:hypothetical protein
MRFRSLIVLFALVSVIGAGASGQTKFLFGGNMGLSVGSAAGQSEAGFQFGPMFEVVFQKSLAVGTELNINTQEGTPVEWADYFKYYFTIPGSGVRPYVDGGFNLWFVTGGPYFGLRFGGGANIPVARNLYVSPDMQLGPVFTTGSTTFYFAMRGGIRYQF